MKAVTLTVLLIQLIFVSSFSQTLLRRDDFLNVKTYWLWQHTGTALPPILGKGYVSVNLINPNSQQYCNTELMDPTNQFSYSNIRMRVKAGGPKKPGSWGWGYWHTEGIPGQILFDFAWFFEQKDINAQSPLTFWRGMVGQKNGIIPGVFVDLDTLVDQTQWHTYKVEWYPTIVNLWVDSIEVLSTTNTIPQSLMAFHFWVDNRIYDLQGSASLASWSSENELMMDFVEIYEGEYPSVSVPAQGNMKVREIYNEIGYGWPDYYWKDVNYNSLGGETVVIVTGRAEQYGLISNDDDCKILIDGIDYGWDTPKSLNGEVDSAMVKTLFFSSIQDSGDHRIEIWGDITPTLYDVTVLSSPNGKLILCDSLRESSPGGINMLWKEYNFYCRTGIVSFYIAGCADEDSTHQLGNPYNDEYDDDLMIEIDTESYGWKTEQSLYGNELFGEGKSVLIQKQMSEGNHTLKLWSNNSPTKTSVIIFEENGVVTKLNNVEYKSFNPNIFDLYQNYPNPFNNNTLIRFILFESMSIKLDIYDLEGRLVKTLVNSRLTSGEHQIMWDGTNNKGNKVTSGIYFYRLYNNRFQNTKKILMIN